MNNILNLVELLQDEQRIVELYGRAGLPFIPDKEIATVQERFGTTDLAELEQLAVLRTDYGGSSNYKASRTADDEGRLSIEYLGRNNNPTNGKLELTICDAEGSLNVSLETESQNLTYLRQLVYVKDDERRTYNFDRGTFRIDDVRGEAIFGEEHALTSETLSEGIERYNQVIDKAVQLLGSEAQPLKKSEELKLTKIDVVGKSEYVVHFNDGLQAHIKNNPIMSMGHTLYREFEARYSHEGQDIGETYVSRDGRSSSRRSDETTVKGERLGEIMEHLEAIRDHPKVAGEQELRLLDDAIGNLLEFYEPLQRKFDVAQPKEPKVKTYNL